MTITDPPRVVVTGMGAVTPLGTDFSTSWRRLVAGEDGGVPVTLFDVSGCRCRRAAQAELPDLPRLNAKQLRRLSRASRLVLPAAGEALSQAGLLDADGRSRLSLLPVSVSTTGGGMALGEAFYRAVLARQSIVNQFFRVVRYTPQQQILDLQQSAGFRGPITIIANACASGANAIGHARDLIRSARAECVLTGGYEALTELIYVGFDCLQALSIDRCRPFDVGRSGLMLGEAAAFLVLESERHARERGATILCEMAGYGHGTDLNHLTQPQPEGRPLVRAMQQALADARLDAPAIGYVNAHGTATPLNDASECAAFGDMFGDVGAPLEAGRPSEIAPGKALPQDGALPRISSTKAAIGHTLGAAGSIEALFSIQALLTGQLPPQINLRQPEPQIAGRLVALSERNAAMRATMSVNLGFGGSNAALIFSRHES